MRTTADLSRTEENLNSSILAIGSLDKALTAAGDKYVYMQELRDYVSALCDFLQVCLIFVGGYFAHYVGPV